MKTSWQPSVKKPFYSLRWMACRLGSSAGRWKTWLSVRMMFISIQSQPLANAMQAVLTEIESTSRDLQCEIALLFLPPELTTQEEIWTSLGYEMCTVEFTGRTCLAGSRSRNIGKRGNHVFQAAAERSSAATGLAHPYRRVCSNCAVWVRVHGQ